MPYTRIAYHSVFNQTSIQCRNIDIGNYNDFDSKSILKRISKCVRGFIILYLSVCNFVFLKKYLTIFYIRLIHFVFESLFKYTMYYVLFYICVLVLVFTLSTTYLYRLYLTFELDRRQFK